MSTDFIKPKFTLKLIPKFNLYSGLFILISGSIAFSFLFQGLFFSFYASVVFSQTLVLNEFVFGKTTLKLIALAFSSLGVLMASFFAYQIWFGKFNFNKNYKRKYSYLTYSQKDVLWGSLSFLLRITVNILILSVPIQFQIMGNELLLVFVLNFLVLTLKENNHLKQVYKVSWKYDFFKLIAYIILAILLVFVSFPFLNKINQKLAEKTIKSKYNIELPYGKDVSRFYCGCDSYYFFEKNNQLFVSDNETNVKLDKLSELISTNRTEKKNFFCDKETFFIDKNISMAKIEKLMYEYSKLGEYILVFAVKPDYYRVYCSNIYFMNNYQILRNGKVVKIVTTHKEVIKLEGTPPPPPLQLPYFLDFDKHQTDEHNFNHLHLSSSRKYYWNDTVVSGNKLYGKIYNTIGSDNSLIYSYDANISFGSLVNIINYTKNIREDKIANWEEENNYDLFHLEFEDAPQYDSIMQQFRLKSAVLNGYYKLNN